MFEYNVGGREACVEMVAKEKSLIMSTVSHEPTKKLELSLMGKTSAGARLFVRFLLANTDPYVRPIAFLEQF